VPRRVVITCLSEPSWTPPGVSLSSWRRALADDAVDLLATLAETEPALAVETSERSFASAVAWPTMRVYAVPRLTVASVLAAATEDGFDQAAVMACDAPDLPGMLIAKLLRPLSTRDLAAAPDAARAHGLVGLASRLPAPEWLPDLDLDEATVASIRSAAPAATEIIGTPGWHRLRSPETLGRLDPDLDGWEATRSLLATSAPAEPGSAGR
jgi:molybdopterin-guanine dinucleotide biosynthesis protein A